MARLERLGSLPEKGILTDEEFAAEKSRLLDGGAADIREYDAADGLVSPESVRRQRTLRTDARGRVWYATTGGLSVADPSRFSSTGLPPTSMSDIVPLSPGS